MNEELLNQQNFKQSEPHKNFASRLHQFSTQCFNILNIGTILQVYSLYIALVIYQLPALSFLSLVISSLIYTVFGSSSYSMYSPSLAAIWIMKQQKIEFDYYYIATITLFSGLLILVISFYKDSFKIYVKNFPKKLIISSLWSFSLYFCLEQIDFAFGDFQYSSQYEYPDAFQKLKYAFQNSLFDVECEKYLIYTFFCISIIGFCFLRNNFYMPIVFMIMCAGISFHYFTPDQFKPFYQLIQQQIDILPKYQMDLNISQFLRKLDVNSLKMSLILSISLIAESICTLYINKRIYKDRYCIKKELIVLAVQNIVSSIFIGLPVSINIIVSVLHAKLQDMQIQGDNRTIIASNHNINNEATNSNSKGIIKQKIQSILKPQNFQQRKNHNTFIGICSGIILQLIFMIYSQAIMNMPVFIICAIQYSAVFLFMHSLIKQIKSLSNNGERHRSETIAIIILGIFWNPIVAGFIGLIYYILSELEAIKNQNNPIPQDNSNNQNSRKVYLSSSSSESIGIEMEDLQNNKNKIEKLKSNRETIRLNQSKEIISIFPYLQRQKTLQIDFIEKLTKRQVDFQSEQIEEKIMFRQDYDNIILNFNLVQEIDDNAWESIVSLLKDLKHYKQQIIFLDVEETILEKMFEVKEICECMKIRKATINWVENNDESLHQLNLLYYDE